LLQALQKLVGKDQVKCLAAKRDMYNRVLGVCFDARTGVELNKEMINEGEAIAVSLCLAHGSSEKTRT
jgi:endonuclease YncB( thermonuclease family)